MTVQAQVSVYSQVFVPRDYDVFAGLDVDHHSIAATFTDHDGLMQSLRLPYSAEQLLNHVRKHFLWQRLAFVYEAGPSGFGLYDELVAEQHTCLVVAPPMVPTAPGNRVKTNRLDSRKLASVYVAANCKAFMYRAVSIGSCGIWCNCATARCRSIRKDKDKLRPTGSPRDSRAGGARVAAFQKMKRCPTRKRVENDDALVFCRVDGIGLVGDSSPLSGEAGTARLGSASAATEIETSILPHSGESVSRSAAA